MKRIKKYEVTGLMEWHPLLTAGSVSIRIPFEGGHLSGYGTTPAVFETDNPVIQKIIESSSYFKEGRIRQGAVYEIPDHDVGNEEKDSKPSASRRFSTLAEAREWLKMEKGVPASRLLNARQCLDEARKIGEIIEIESEK